MRPYSTKHRQISNRQTYNLSTSSNQKSFRGVSSYSNRNKQMNKTGEKKERKACRLAGRVRNG